MVYFTYVTHEHVLLNVTKVFLSLYSKVNGQGKPNGATPPTVLYQFFQNFTGVLVMV